MQLTDEMRKMRASGASYAAIAGKCGVAKSTIQEAFGVRKGRGSWKHDKAVVSVIAKGGRSLAEFRKQYDKDLIIPRKIREALTALKNTWVYEREFVSMAGITFNDLGNYRDMFANHVVALRHDNKRIWAGKVSLANQLKGVVS